MTLVSKVLSLFKNSPKGPVYTKSDLFAIMAQAGKSKGVDPSLLVAIANIESSLNPMAKAATSSALGLFQFVDATWRDLVTRYGKEDGVSLDSEHRTDPRASSLMMCELIKENQNYLWNKGIKDLSKTDLYLAHFLGPNKAMKFIAQKRANGSVLGSTMFPSEAYVNRSVFFSKVGATVSDSTPRTLNEIYDIFTEKLKDYGLT